jgi:hypothetical protein
VDWRGVLICTLGLWGLWNLWQRFELRPVHPADGPLATTDPLQTDLERESTAQRGRWTLTGRAHYEVTARILGREEYRMDPLSDLIPEDLALGWGPMSDNRVLESFEISQSARFYSWHPRKELPIPREEVIEHSANTHVIAADEHVGSQLKRLRVGEVVRLTGVLVDAVRDDGTYIHTSLTRSDSGAGACEVMLAEGVEVL